MKLLLIVAISLALQGCAFKVGYSGQSRSQLADGKVRKISIGSNQEICYPCFYVGDYVFGIYSDWDSYFGNIHFVGKR